MYFKELITWFFSEYSPKDYTTGLSIELSSKYARRKKYFHTYNILISHRNNDHANICVVISLFSGDISVISYPSTQM